MDRPLESLESFLAHTLAIEREAADRYSEFEARLRDRGEEVLADLCHQLRLMDLDQLRVFVGAAEGLALPPIAASDHLWLDGEAPNADAHELLYRIATPRQLLEVALGGERNAERFFEWAARTSPHPAVRALARGLAREERAHERWLGAALAYREPAADWERLLAGHRPGSARRGLIR